MKGFIHQWYIKLLKKWYRKHL